MTAPREVFEPLVTRRLELREPRAEHARAMYDAFTSDPDVTRYLRWRPHRCVEEAESAMTRRLERLRDGSELSWVVVVRATDAVVGVVSLWPSSPYAELGFAFARAAWGEGLATEAAHAAVAWAFERLGVERVWASCDVENAASSRVLEKLGMRRERLARAFAVHPNLGPEPRDCLVYAVRRSDPS